MPFSPITLSPAVPQRTQDEETFSSLADPFVAWMSVHAEEMDTFKSELEVLAAATEAAPAYADPGLLAMVGNTPAADKFIYFTGASTSAIATVTAQGRTFLAAADQAEQRTALGMSANGSSLVAAADYAAMKTLLDLEVGTDVQAYDADLAAIAALTTTSIGRSLLAIADAAAGRTALDAQQQATITTNANGTALALVIGAATYYLQFAYGSYTTTEGSQTITWPVEFPTSCIWAGVATNLSASGSTGDAWYQTVGNPSTTTCTVYRQSKGQDDSITSRACVIGFGY